MSSEVSGNPPRFGLLGVCPEFSGLIPGWDPAVGFDKRSMLFQVCLGAVALCFFFIRIRVPHTCLVVSSCSAFRGRLQPEQLC